MDFVGHLTEANLRLLLSCGIPFVSRFLDRPSKGDILESQKRSRILQVVQSNPGIQIARLIRHVKFGSGTVYHHVGVLSRRGFIRVASIGRRRHLYPMRLLEDQIDEAKDFSVLLSPSATAIASAVERSPGATAAEVQKATKFSSRVVYYHLRRLVESGLILTAEHGSYSGMRASDRLVDRLANLRGSRTVSAGLGGDDRVEPTGRSPRVLLYPVHLNEGSSHNPPHRPFVRPRDAAADFTG